MVVTGKALPRRTFLRGVGATAVALPFLDAMAPALSAKAGPPVRLAFLYVPNGIDMANWNVPHEGALPAELPRILKPLEAFRGDMIQIGNLTHNSGRALLDGAGDHGRCAGSYLTGIQVRKSTIDIKASISCDQIIANAIGHQTRFASLEMGMDDSRQAGDCDSGYSCAYTNNLAWRSETQPLPPVLDPRVLFERLFGTDADLTPEQRERRTRYRRSILDFIMGDTQRLKTDLGPTDRRKLDEYLSSIREVERQLEKAERESIVIDPGMAKPYGVPPDFGEHFKLMTDMLTIAFQADLTRVATFMMTREGTSRSYREIGIPDGHHPCTHHQGRQELMDKVTRINEYHTQQLAGFLHKLKNTPEGDSNLLDNSMIVYGAGLSDGNRHWHHDLPVIMAGKANGTITTGRHLKFDDEVPLNNLFLSMLDRHTHEDLPTLLIGKGGNAFRPGRRVIYRRETPMANFHLTLMDRMGVHVENFGDASGRLDLAEVG